MTTDGPKQGRLPPVAPPPRTLDVRKYAESRAAELESLHSIVSNRLNDDFRSRRNKRRRTTGFDTKKKFRRRKRQKTLNSDNDKEREVIDKEKKKLPRRVRRRIELKKNLETGFSASGDGSRRLRTHVWHAKRFTMAKLWGFYLPLGLHGRGRGSRALLKWYKEGAVIHDASYYSAVQLEGPEDSLLSITNMFLVPSPMDHADDISKCILSGDIYGSAMLYHAGQDHSKAICPVTYMWRPLHEHDNGVGTKDKEADENIKPELSSSIRQLWIWMHPSALRDGFDCLKLACQKMIDETGVLVDCVSLDGQLARLEIMGSKAFQLLQKILHPLTISSRNSVVLKSCLMLGNENGSEIKQESPLEKAECLSSNAVVPLTVNDPRLCGKRSDFVPEDHLASQLCGLLEDKNEEHLAGNNLESKYESDSSLSNSKDLWDAYIGVRPPMEESVLCLERHKKSLDFFCLKDTTSAKCASNEAQFSRFCPILLLRNTDQAGLVIGWSIVLPISWVKAFWIALVSGGAHAIGLREKHWIAGDMGLPYFPSDFPDCDAYSLSMEREAEAFDKTMESRPRDMRPFKVPIKLPWNNVIDFSNNVEGNGDQLADSNCEISDIPSVNDSGSSSEVFIARTSVILTSFLREISGDHLPLFPKGSDRMSFSNFMKDEAKVCQASNVDVLTSRGRRLCYLRVLLHAYKEGVFDERAVVCAPRFSDLSLWTSRSENTEDGLQVPQAFVGSYFKEVTSGKWEFQLPEDPVAREAYRQPIGFVTTGFVRGSKKPVAVALCEAVLIAQLRHEQWSRVPAKRRRKEIFVLVRNLRSTAYRLARATIVLEGHKEDVKSI